jgi:hypothetical protein
MRSVNRRTGPIAALFLVLAALAGPSSGSAAHTSSALNTLHVDLTEWAVVPSQGLVSSGPLRLSVQNYGVVVHRLAIIPTQVWGEKLGVRNGRAVGEPAVRPVVVRPGQTRSAQVDLAPGAYVLLDNIRGHYAAGGAVSIIVR